MVSTQSTWGPHSVENLILGIIENHFTEPQNLEKSCWTKPIPVIVAVVRPVRIVTAKSANVLAARQAAKTVHVLAASRKSTKIQEKNEEINKIFTIVTLKKYFDIDFNHV